MIYLSIHHWYLQNIDSSQLPASYWHQVAATLDNEMAKYFHNGTCGPGAADRDHSRYLCIYLAIYLSSYLMLSSYLSSYLMLSSYLAS